MQKFFDHNFLTKVNLKREDTDSGRFYITPEAKRYPSVTTVLGRSKEFPKDGLDAWRARVGEDQANRTMTQARNRGTEMHGLLERYMLNTINYVGDAMPVNVESFEKIKPYLNDHIGTVFGIELPLYSDTLKAAGTADLIADWGGVKTLIDLKTSKRLKKEEWILPYFIQATCYAFMHNERYPDKRPIKDFVVFISVDDEEPQMFKKPITDYLSLMIKIFNQDHEGNSP
jgi:genome maintenance exonuclease 1